MQAAAPRTIITAQDFSREVTTALAEESYKKRPLLEAQGRILYSPAATLRRAPFYLLGVNPGGDPESETDTIKTNLQALDVNPCHSYVCGWRNDGKGAPDNLRSTMRWLFSSIGYNIQDVCTSNLLFVRSPGDDDKDVWTTEAACWKVHEMVLNIVQPSVILIFHRKAFKHFCRSIRADMEFSPINQLTFPGDISSRGKRNKAGGSMLRGRLLLQGERREIALFQFPHPSYNLPPLKLVEEFQKVARQLSYEPYTGNPYPRRCEMGHDIGII